MQKKVITVLLGLLIGLSAIHADVVWNNESIGEYKLTQPGVYKIKGTVKGNINIELKSQGKVVIEGVDGTNPVLQGIPRPGERRHVSHIKGSIPASSSIIVRNFTFMNNTRNGMEFAGTGSKVIQNVHMMNYTRIINGKEVFGAGCINAGENSEIRGSLLETGDDAIKITEPGSSAYNTTCNMYGNGSAIQMGWEKRGNGADHIAENVTVKGSLKVNINHDSPNTDNNPGRAVIGGSFQNNVNNIRITGLKIHGTDYARLIKIVADGSVVKNVLIQGELLDGLANHKDNKGRTWYAIVLVAKNGGRIENCVIDLGAAAADSKYHFIQGNVDVTFKTSPTPTSTPTPTPTVTPKPTPTQTPPPEAKDPYKRIQAEDFDTQSGVKTETCAEGGFNIGFINNGDQIVYKNLNFSEGVYLLRARVASGTGGGLIEIYENGPNGTYLGALSVPGTGGWQNWQTLQVPISPISGTKNICLVFTGGSGFLLNLNWLKFTPAN